MCAAFDWELVEFKGEDNHIHLLVNSPPKVARSKLINSLKDARSAELVRTTTTQPALRDVS